MSKTTKQTQQPTLDHAEKAVNKPELAHAKDGDLPEVTKGKWTKADDQFLRDNAGKLTAYELSVKLGRTRGAVKFRAGTLGVSLRSKKPTQIDKIKELAGKMSVQDIAKKLGTTVNTVTVQAIKQQISLAYKCIPWTLEQDAYLRKNASLLTARELSRVLGRTPAAVTARAVRLDVTLAKFHRVHHQVQGFKNQKAVPLKFKNRPLPDDCN